MSQPMELYWATFGRVHCEAPSARGSHQEVSSSQSASVSQSWSMWVSSQGSEHRPICRPTLSSHREPGSGLSSSLWQVSSV